MNTNKAISTIGLMSVLLCSAMWHSNATAQDIRDSMITVDELLKIDNAQALEKARSDAIKSGMMQPPKLAGAKIELPLPRWTVKSVFGVGGHMAADIVVDGSTAFSVTPGNSVAMCRVEHIQSGCVGLAPINPKVRKGSCPAKVCWTGNELTAELHPSQTVNAQTVATRMAPSPLPTPPIPIPTGSDAPTSTPFPSR